MRRFLLLILAFAAMLVLSQPAWADSITVGGITYSYSASQDGSDPANVWDVTLVIDTSGAVQAGTLSSFSVQFTGATGVAWEDMGGTTGWGTFASGPNTAQGCQASSANHWCTSTSNAITFSNDGTGGTYTFVFDVTMPVGTPLPSTAGVQAFQGQGPLATSCAGIGLTGPNGTLTGDCGGTPIPEPGSLMLFGTGLLGLAGYLRRRLKA